MKILIALILLCSFASAQQAPEQYPDAPSCHRKAAQVPMPEPPPPVKAVPPKESWSDKWDRRSFWPSVAFMAAGGIYDAEVTHQGLAHHKCVEGNMDWVRYPSRGMLYRQIAIPDAAIFGMGYLIHKGKIKFIPQGMFLANGAWHFEAASSWPLYCW